MARLYNLSAWKKLRTGHLAKNPLCVYCLDEDRIVSARIVDHITPHKGDMQKFLDPANLQGLCKQHHDSTKQREEKAQVVVGGDKDGRPLDPNHHWNRKGGVH